MCEGWRCTPFHVCEDGSVLLFLCVRDRGVLLFPCEGWYLGMDLKSIHIHLPTEVVAIECDYVVVVVVHH